MRNKSIIAIFLLIIFAILAMNLTLPDKNLSKSERRRLAQRPVFSVETVMDGQYMTAFDKYTTDQFVCRELFRGLKVFAERNILLKSDTNKLFEAGGGIYKIEYPLQPEKVLSLCKKLTAVQTRYLDGQQVYYAIVPDKNYYLPKSGTYLLMAYDELVTLMGENMREDAQYIDLFDSLTTENYYKSDGHWRQETLKPVVDKLYRGMGINAQFDPSQYEARRSAPFYGAYYGQLVGMAPPDTLCWLENRATKDAVVTRLDTPGENLPVYYEDGLKGMDAYDVFLYGAIPLIELENTHNETGRELIVFRDSFGSSLAPLLLENYSRITLVDLRYITQDLLGEYIDFAGQDILFLFSTTIINNSDIIR